MVRRVLIDFLLQLQPLDFSPVSDQAENFQQAILDPVDIKTQPVAQFVAGFSQVSNLNLNNHRLDNSFRKLSQYY